MAPVTTSYYRDCYHGYFLDNFRYHHHHHHRCCDVVVVVDGGVSEKSVFPVVGRPSSSGWRNYDDDDESFLLPLMMPSWKLLQWLL